MYDGTTELKSKELARISSPIVEVKLRSNFIKGAEQTAFPNLSSINNGIVFNNLVVLAGNSAFPDIIGNIKVYTQDGASLVTNINLNDSNLNGTYDFVDTGSTLVLYYADSLNNIRRLSSNNATTWGGSELLSASSKNIWSLSATGASRVYALLDAGNTTYLGDFPTKTLTSLVSYSQVGASFVGTTISLGTFYGEELYMEKHLGTRDIDRGSVVGSRLSNAAENIYTFKSDGANLFNFSPVYTENINQVLSLNASNLAKGISKYYVFIAPNIQVIDKTKGTSFSYSVGLKSGFITTNDFEHWQTPVILGISQASGVIALTGLSGTEFAFLGLSRIVNKGFLKFYAGSSTLDVSDHIVSYSNNNNERINLTLGNYE